MVRKHTPLRWLCLSLLAGSLASPAIAQDGDAPIPGEDEAPPTFEELGWVPHFRVVAFQDREGTGDCDRAYARYGECVELVDFVPYELIAQNFPVWNDRLLWKELLAEQADGASRRNLRRQRRAVFAQWRSMNELYTEMWEDMVYRWKTTDDDAMKALQAGGYKVFPETTDQLDISYPGRRRSFSMPEHDNWLHSSRWLQPFYSQLPEFDPADEEAIDSDGDGLSDAREQQLQTKPRVADSDRDGYTDGEEVANETSPLDPDDFPKFVEEDKLPFYRLVKYALPDGQ